MQIPIPDYEKFKVVRPLLGALDNNSSGMPIIKRSKYPPTIFENNIIPIGWKSLSSKDNNSNKLILTFSKDSELDRLWNDPNKWVPIFHSSFAIVTPDFSVSPQMHKIELTHQIFKNRWLGYTYQEYGCNVYPSVAWALPDTYDICFSGIEIGSIVVVSTLGAQNNFEAFITGFNEMKKRILPPLIIVFGGMLPEMYGTFVNFSYEDALSTPAKKRYEQLPLFKERKIFTYKEGA